MTIDIEEKSLRYAFLEDLQQPKEIALSLGVSRRTVERRLKKLGISRDLSSLAFPEAPLRRLYLDEERSLESIAQTYRVDLAQLAERVIEVGVPLREKHMDETWLRREYVEKGRTTYEIAEELGTTNKLVSDWLGNLGISTKKPAPLYHDRDWLFDQYVTREKSLRQIAGELGVSYGPIQHWIHTHGIPVRGETYSGYKSREAALYRDRAWLSHKRIVEEKSESRIAEECGASRSTINRWLKRFDLDGRTLSEATTLRHARNLAKYKELDWLLEEYQTNQRSTYSMAAELGVTPGTILRWLKRLGIPVREADESYFLAHRNYLDVDQYLKEMLEGELLGDGSIIPSGRRTAVYGHGTKHQEYVAWLAEEFANHGLMQSGTIRRVINYLGEDHTSVTYTYRSRSYASLMSFRQRFYPEGKKVVPRGLVLTPIVVRQWYIGDGQLHGPPRQRAAITLHTCAFDPASIDFLMAGLSELGFKVTHQKAHNAIHVSAHSTEEFLLYIGLCPEPIACVYRYKWDTGNGN